MFSQFAQYLFFGIKVNSFSLNLQVNKLTETDKKKNNLRETIYSELSKEPEYMKVKTKRRKPPSFNYSDYISKTVTNNNYNKGNCNLIGFSQSNPCLMKLRYVL